MTDVMIIGGGFPGLVAALACSKLDLKVKLFDIKSSLNDSQAHAFKPIVLNAASWQLMSALGVTKDLKEKAYGLKTMHVLRYGWSKFTFNAQPHRHPNLGYVVMGAELQNALANHVANDKNISCYLNADIKQVTAGQSPSIQTTDQTHRSRLILVADGRQSVSRQSLGIAYEQASWHKSALVASVSLDANRSDAYLKFVPGGTIACIPTATSKHQIILATKEEDEIFTLESKALLPALQALMGEVCTIKHVDMHKVFPLGQGIAPEIGIPGALLIGDAGFAIPPVGAQGLNLAFYDIAVLADLLAKAQESDMSLSSKAFVDRFNHLVMPHHDRLLKGIKGLMTMTDWSAPWLQSLQGVALFMANYVSPFKHYVAEFGMGFRYPMPSLIRGRIPKVYPRIIKTNEVDDHV